MFDKQYRFLGSHAEKVNELTAIFDADAKAKLFERNLDVYINAPLIGYLFHQKGEKNTDGEIPAQNIFPEQMINASDTLQYILRLILLLDSENEPDEGKRLDKAFRWFGQEEDLLLFDQYVLGGVDVLYEKLIADAGGPDDYITNMYDFLEEFNDRFNSEITNDDILELCRKTNN